MYLFILIIAVIVLLITVVCAFISAYGAEKTECGCPRPQNTWAKWTAWLLLSFLILLVILVILVIHKIVTTICQGVEQIYTTIRCFLIRIEMGIRHGLEMIKKPFTKAKPSSWVFV